MSGIGNRIKQRLADCGMLQSQLAKAIRIDPTYISAYVCGRSSVRADHLRLIAGALNVDIEWLSSGKGLPTNVPVPVSTPPETITKPTSVTQDDVDEAVNKREVEAMFITNLSTKIRQIIKEELTICTQAETLAARIQKLPSEKQTIIETIVNSLST